MVTERRRERNYLTDFVMGAVTLYELKVAAWALGGDVFSSHCILMAIDVVGGPTVAARVEQLRPAGVYVRWFNTHQERLAEFQGRLDAAKRRAGMI